MLDIEAQEIVSDHIAAMLKNKDRYFGNARSIRKLVAESVQKQHLRMAGLSKLQRTASMIKTITAADIVTPAVESRKPKKGMGFSIE